MVLAGRERSDTEPEGATGVLSERLQRRGGYSTVSR